MSLPLSSAATPERARVCDATEPDVPAAESSLPKKKGKKVNRCALCGEISTKRCGRCEKEKYCSKGNYLLVNLTLYSLSLLLFFYTRRHITYS